MAWLDEAKKRLSEVSPQSEDYAALSAAIADMESPRETRGAKEGFISQQYPTSTQPFEPGDYIENKDGGWSSERTITVTDPRLNNGKPTVIPSLWKKGGNPTDLSEEDSVKAAIGSGRAWPSFRSIPEAERFANDREDTWQRVGREGAGGVPSLTQVANKIPEYDLERSYRTAYGVGPYSMSSQMYPETILPGDALPRENIETSQEASRRIAARPPELIHPPGPHHPLTSPLAALYDYLPTWALGKTTMWEEPKLIEFRSDPTMRGALGPGIEFLWRVARGFALTAAL